MNIRKKTLWWLPVYYLAASVVGYYVLISLRAAFCVEATVGPDGVATATMNTALSNMIGLVVLAAVLLLGGLKLCRRMTKKEIALSAGILTAVYLLWVGSELLFPGWDAAIGSIYSMMSLNAEVGGLLVQLIQAPTAMALIGCFTPMLFIPFGRNQLPLGAE